VAQLGVGPPLNGKHSCPSKQISRRAYLPCEASALGGSPVTDAIPDHHGSAARIDPEV
jgi:hypothetical protein